jgi:hypothetical protein
MADKYSNGAIVGLVLDDGAQTPIADALVSVDVISAGNGRVTLFNDHDVAIQNLNVRTNKQGGFALVFRWDPTTLGSTLDLPRYKININRPLGGQATELARAVSREGELFPVVSLREVGSGRIPSFKTPNSIENIVKDLKTILKVYGWKFPNMFVGLGRPSGDSYELIGAIRTFV